MPVTIKNLTNKPKLVPLRSRMMQLGPRAVSSEVMDIEVEGNAMIQKLVDQRIIVLHKTKTKAQTIKRTPVMEEKKPVKEVKKEEHKKTSG